MQDLLKRIIKMDEQARKIEQQAKDEKIKSEAEVEQLKEQIYNDYIVRAKDRVEKNIAVDRENAEKRYAQAKQHQQDMKQEMNRLYEQNKDSWVDEIVKRALA
ncbi:hypothetical protein [Ruminococcus difficilis]|uniref:Uncharacterized protein n=1 Tax=Ruminococcus difficilis TaxID=2763069 RepID=A0A934WRC7_9FIRM|nr:hypothetical protein [Ruminococcus difficilis]MBK6087860.1 hypothetical protein [Ruminococcus difficilis]